MENIVKNRQRAYSFVNWHHLKLKDEVRTVFYDSERGCDTLFCIVTDTQKDHLVLTETGKLYGHYRIPSKHPIRLRIDDNGVNFRYYKIN